MGNAGDAPSFARLALRIVRNVALMALLGVGFAWTVDAVFGPPTDAIDFVLHLCALMMAFFALFEALDALVMKGESPSAALLVIGGVPFALFGGLAAAAIFRLGLGSYPYIVGAMLTCCMLATAVRTVR